MQEVAVGGRSLRQVFESKRRSDIRVVIQGVRRGALTPYEPYRSCLHSLCSFEYPGTLSRTNRIQPCNPSAEKQLTTCHWFIVQITHKELHGASVFKQHWGGTLVEHEYSRIGRLPVRSKHASEVRQCFKACDTPNCKVPGQSSFGVSSLSSIAMPSSYSVAFRPCSRNRFSRSKGREPGPILPTTQKVAQHP